MAYRRFRPIERWKRNYLIDTKHWDDDFLGYSAETVLAAMWRYW